MMSKRPREHSDEIIFDTDSSGDDGEALSNALPRPQSMLPAVRLQNSISALIEKKHSACIFEGTDCAQVDNTTDRTPDGADDAYDEDISIVEQRLRCLLTEPASRDEDKATSALPTTASIFSYLLRTYFSLSSGQFRSGQEEVIRRILRKESVLAVFPTGYGKSLCYQVPVLVRRILQTFAFKKKNDPEANGGHLDSRMKGHLQSSFAVVISPLLALIADQMSNIRRHETLRAVAITSNTGRDAEEDIYRTLGDDASSNPIDIVFVSPESFVGKQRLRQALRENLHRISFLCIDEAHCISSWSHDFRPSYLYLKRSLDSLVDSRETDACTMQTSCCSPPILALTATAPEAVRDELCNLLGIRYVVDRMQPRKNLKLESIKLSSADPRTQIATTFAAVLTALRELEPPFLVYAGTQVQVDELTRYLMNAFGKDRNRETGDAADPTANQHKFMRRHAEHSSDDLTMKSNSGIHFNVAAFHAGLPQSQRTAAQKGFLSGTITVLVATIAFGMGVDKPNIRSVIHCAIPASLTAYAQETGRGGRDGLPSVCRALFSTSDFFLLRRRALGHLLSFSDVKTIIQRIFSSPVTIVAPKKIIVSTEQLAGEVCCAAETVETVMYLLLLSHPHILACLDGKVQVSFRVWRMGDEDENELDDEREGTVDTTTHHKIGDNRHRHWTAQRRVDAARRYNGTVQGVLKQLDVVCEVETFCRTNLRSFVPNIVHAANAVGLSIQDFLFRLKALESSKRVMLRWCNSGFLVGCGSSFPPSEESVHLIAKEIYQKLKKRVAANIQNIHEMFHFLETSPSQESLVSRLLKQEDSSAPQSEVWSPPTPGLTRLQAVDIVDDFVRNNKLRIRNAFEATKALAGVFPGTSASNVGMSDGITPLAGSWYVKHPHFGALQEFDFEWILKAVMAHGISDTY